MSVCLSYLLFFVVFFVVFMGHMLPEINLIWFDLHNNNNNNTHGSVYVAINATTRFI